MLQDRRIITTSDRKTQRFDWDALISSLALPEACSFSALPQAWTLASCSRSYSDRKSSSPLRSSLYLRLTLWPQTAISYTRNPWLPSTELLGSRARIRVSIANRLSENIETCDGAQHVRPSTLS